MLKPLLIATLVFASSAAQGHEGACSPINDIKFSIPPTFQTQPVSFPTTGATMVGCLYAPAGKANFPVVVSVAGADLVPTATDIYTVIHAKAYTNRGIGFFAFNKRGIGGSTGVGTSTNFRQRAEDVASAVRFIRGLKSTGRIGLWGSSQAGWVVPYALRPKDGVTAIMLTSPSGVNAFEQVAYYINTYVRGLGFTPEEADKAERVHRAAVRYYATADGYREAQAMGRRYAKEPWFEKFRANDEWNEHIGPGGTLLSPAELRSAWHLQADDFEFYRAPSTFQDFAPAYALLDRPTIIINGTADLKVPVLKSKPAIEAAILRRNRKYIEYKDFDGADHGIQDGPRVRQAYLDFLSEWAVAHLGT